MILGVNFSAFYHLERLGGIPWKSMGKGCLFPQLCPPDPAGEQGFLYPIKFHLASSPNQAKIKSDLMKRRVEP
jgi:hypothetical protein